MIAPEIALRPSYDGKRLLIVAPYSRDLHARVMRIPGAQYSSGRDCWHVSNRQRPLAEALARGEDPVAETALERRQREAAEILAAGGPAVVGTEDLQAGDHVRQLVGLGAGRYLLVRARSGTDLSLDPATARGRRAAQDGWSGDYAGHSWKRISGPAAA